MRRHLICSILLGLVAALAVPALASAAPTVTFKARAVPIPKPGGGSYPHTGNILGAGAAVQAEFTLSGSGYGATPQNPAGGIPPLSQVNFFLPAGAKINSHGFGTCSAPTLNNTGPAGCKKKAIASPKGSALGEVSFGSERVPETASLQAFFAPGSGLLFYVQGSSPVSLEFVSAGRYVNSSKPYGLELQTQVPAIATVPGAPLASTKTITVKVGAAFKKGKRLISYGTMPKKCPKGGFPLKAELTFGGSYGGEREFGIPAETVSATYKSPCPRKH
ncbi:MAG TPA: hypothetical protein VMB05_03845 [Solirubrobacteraceae bacterium]|nr:hypothetical protein [Solirubrobacteraceae bacterium]